MLEHRQRDVLPPFLAGKFLEQLLLLSDCRDRQLLQEARRDLLNRAAQPLQPGRVQQPAELEPEDQQIEALCLLVVVGQSGR